MVCPNWAIQNASELKTHTEIKIPSAYRKQRKKSHKITHYKVLTAICSSKVKTVPKF